MEKIAKFEKISLEQWLKDTNEESVEESTAIYNAITLPKRSTIGSAGYDFVAPYNCTLVPNEEHNFPTGIKAKIEDGWFLGAFPRSSLGFKFYARLANTIGVIDASYYNNESNEGHIWVKIRNEGNKTFEIKQGDKIFQGIFIPYGITVDDDVTAERTGGFGSTGS